MGVGGLTIILRCCLGQQSVDVLKTVDQCGDPELSEIIKQRAASVTAANGKLSGEEHGPGIQTGLHRHNADTRGGIS